MKPYPYIMEDSIEALVSSFIAEKIVISGGVDNFWITFQPTQHIAILAYSEKKDSCVRREMIQNIFWTIFFISHQVISGTENLENRKNQI